MRVKYHRGTKDISEYSSTNDGSHIAVEVGKQAHIDREVDHEKDDEILYDAIVSDFFEEIDIGDKGRYHCPI
jgi:hypothetical protein